MSSVVINLHGDTYIHTRNMDTNYSNADRLKYGNDNNGTSNAVLLFRIEPSLMLYHKILENVTLKFRVASKQVYNNGNVSDSSLMMGEVIVYDGAQEDYINQITQRNSSGYLTGLKATTRIERLSVNNGEYASVNIGTGNYDWNNGWLTVVIKGWTTGNYYYYGELYANDACLIVEYEVRIPTLTLSEPESNILNNANPFSINWEYACEAGLSQKSYEIGWSSNGGASWNTTTAASDQTVHEYPANTFPGGNIKLRLRVTNIDNQVSAYATIDIFVTDNVPSVTASYPNEVNLNNSSKSIFTWDFTEEVLVGQKSYEIGWSSNGGANWNTVTVVAGRHYHEYPANTFPVGSIRWRIRATNNYNKISGYSYAEFTAIGQTAAPIIKSVSENAIPTIVWEAGFQDCYEIRIREGGKIIYESGLQIGQEVRSYQCNIMLGNGIYSIEMRLLNTYGYYTEWISYNHILNLPEPEAPGMVFASVSNDFGVDISGNTVNGLKTYVVRKDSDTGEEQILGIYGGEYHDYKAALKKPYQYTLRTYAANGGLGYANGEMQDITVNVEGVLIHDIRDYKNFVKLYIGEDVLFNIERSDSYTKAVYQCIGRKYPVKEQMDWIITTRKITAWVSDSDYSRLLDICNNSGTAYYRAEQEAFLCDIEMELRGYYVGGGKFVSITVSRLDEKTEVIL